MRWFEGNYTALAACKIANGFAISLNFSDDSSKIIITTNRRKMLMLDPVSFLLEYTPEEISQQFWSNFVGKFMSLPKSPNSFMMPIVLGNVTNMVAAGDEYGNIYVWNNVECIKDNIGSNFQSHASLVQGLDLTPDDKRLLSFGQYDQCISQFKVKQLFRKEEVADLRRGIYDVKLAS